VSNPHHPKEASYSLGRMLQMNNTLTTVEIALDQGMPKSQRIGTFFKTKGCKFYAAGMCTRGQHCCYSHSIAETRKLPDLYKTELCASFSYYGWCNKGGACSFAHGSSELRNTNTLLKQIPTTHKALPDARISFSNQQQAVAVRPHVATSIHGPQVQTGYRHITASKPGLAPATCKLHAPWSTTLLRQSWNPAFLEAQRCSYEGPLSSHMGVEAVGGCRRNYEEKKEENCQSQQHVRTISVFDDCARSSGEVDSVQESAPEDRNEHVEFWDRQTTAEGSWAIQMLSRQSSLSQTSEQDAQAEAAELHLIVVNTFLELRSVGSAATRSKSTGGRIESARV